MEGGKERGREGGKERGREGGRKEGGRGGKERGGRGERNSLFPLSFLVLVPDSIIFLCLRLPTGNQTVLSSTDCSVSLPLHCCSNH